MTESRAILHLVTEAEDSGLDGVEGEYREVAMRLRRLVRALDMKQDSFATATGAEGEGGLRRTEINVAWNGGQLAKTTRWSAGVARAAGVDRGTADDYLRGRIALSEVLRRRAKGLAREPVVEREERYHAMPAVRAMARAQHFPEAFVASWEPLLDSDDQPSADELWTLCKADYARSRGKVAATGDPLAGLDDRPVRPARKKR